MEFGKIVLGYVWADTIGNLRNSRENISHDYRQKSLYNENKNITKYRIYWLLEQYFVSINLF